MTGIPIPWTSTDASNNPRYFDDDLVRSGNNGGDDKAYRDFEQSTPITDSGRSKATERARQLNNLLSDFDAVITSACPSTKETAFVLVGAEPEDFISEAEKRSVTSRGGSVIPMISLDEARELKGGESIADRSNAVNAAIDELISKGVSNILLVGHHFFLDAYLRPIEADCSKAGVNLYFDHDLGNLAARSYSVMLPASEAIDPFKE